LVPEVIRVGISSASSSLSGSAVGVASLLVGVAGGFEVLGGKKHKVSPHMRPLGQLINSLGTRHSKDNKTHTIRHSNTKRNWLCILST
jgi:hypothetical protein